MPLLEVLDRSQSNFTIYRCCIILLSMSMNAAWMSLFQYSSASDFIEAQKQCLLLIHRAYPSSALNVHKITEVMQVKILRFLEKLGAQLGPIDYFDSGKRVDC